MLWLGAMTIPGELFGFVRPYGGNVPYRQEAQVMHRKVLLIVVAVLSWTGLISAMILGSLIRTSQTALPVLQC